MLAKTYTRSVSLAKEATKHRFIRYIIAGGLSAAIEIGTLILLVEVFHMTYLRGNVIAFLFTTIFNYILSRKWVFKSEPHKKNKKRVELPVFMFFVGCGFLINQGALWFFVSQIGMRYEIAKIVAIAFVVIWNFFTRKFIVFKKLVPVSEEKEF
jgi:putative flippase GtrA